MVEPMTIPDRLCALDWPAIEASLTDLGYAKTPPILTDAECTDLANLYPDDRHFRKRVDMGRLRFGIGDYAYFANPLPKIVRELRTHAYPRLAPIANRWLEALEQPARYPSTLKRFLETCASRGQKKPTPLLLHYKKGGYNCLHQDLYGEVAFPLQLTIFLSKPGADYDGGEFLLVENRPRQQSRGDAIQAEQGEMVIFPTRERPIAGKSRTFRAQMRHGVSRVTRGERYALGIIFHDAR